jgi:uncharacterized membrane protein YcaP (DUF421 family)
MAVPRGAGQPQREGVKSFDFASLWTPELSPWEVVLRATVIYVFIQVLFRVVGRKELARWGASDIVLLFLIATAARKSIVADDPSLTTAMIALGTIIGLDWALSALSARSSRVADFIAGPVRQLVRDGELQREVMRKTRVSEDELLSHVREEGKESLADVKHAFLERSGKITVIPRERRP